MVHRHYSTSFSSMNSYNYTILIHSPGDGHDSEVKHHRRRRTVTVGSHMTSSAFDANGNRILRVSRREANGADVADVETAERVIQVWYFITQFFIYV